MKTINIGETITLKAVKDQGLHPCRDCYFLDAEIDKCDLCNTINGCAHFELVEE